MIAPTANVLLSYLCQKNTRISIKKYITFFICGTIPLIIFGIIGIWGAPWLAGILYPHLIGDAMPFFFLASTGSIMQNAANMISPLIMSVTSSRNYVILQAIYFMAYLFISYEGALKNGLMGFCIALVIVGMIKMILFFILGYISLKNRNSVSRNES